MAVNRASEAELTGSIRESYDALAGEYSRRIFEELEHKPLDQQLLTRFASRMIDGSVCDLGCGPGHVTRFLQTLGVKAFGLDLSAGMLEQARHLNPSLTFVEGNMLSLNLADHSLAGIVSFYSICNLPREVLSVAFREMVRVLRPGGILLLAFHIGDETLHREEMWGQSVCLNFYLYETKLISENLRRAGFSIEEIVERDPYTPDVEYQSRRAYIFARTPD
jgi:SAM-dependent methyltransferase